MTDKSRDCAVYVGFLGTQHGGFIKRLKQYIRLSEEVNIVTGYISIDGLAEVIEELHYPDRVKILVGVVDEQSERLKRVLIGEEEGGRVGELLRRLHSIGRLDIGFVTKTQGCRLFHSKGYLFKLRGEGQFFICGSNNLTQSGLKYNREWSMETDDFTTYWYAKESFDIDWAIQQQGLESVEEGEYRAEIKRITRGVSSRGCEYLEIVYKVYVESKYYFIHLEKMKLQQGEIPERLYVELSSLCGHYQDIQDIDELITYLDGITILIELVRKGVKEELKIRGRKQCNM